MADLLYQKPLFLAPNRFYRGYPGGREIDRFRGLPNPQDDNCPEAWVGSTTRADFHTEKDPNIGLAEVYLDEGKTTKVYIKEIIGANPAGFLGAKHVAAYGNDLGILVKLLDAKTQLGLQSHPDRNFAAKMFGANYGKTECWYITGLREDQEEKPYVLLGFKEGISREKFQTLFLAGDIRAMENCCHKIRVAAGDMYFVAAGTPHAVGPGCFMVEVQEPSDLIVGARMQHFPDEEKQRHFIEKTMGCYHYDGRSYEDNLAAYKTAPQVIRLDQNGAETLLLGKKQTPYFSVTRIDTAGRFPVMDTTTFSIVIILAGRGTVSYQGGLLPVRQGDEIFAPAGLTGLTWQAENDKLSMVVCHPPGVH